MPHEYDDPITVLAIDTAVNLAIRLQSERHAVPLYPSGECRGVAVRLPRRRGPECARTISRAAVR